MNCEKDYGKNCEAPEHVENCHGMGTTKDHFTSECIGKVWGWSQEQLDSEENIQYLSPQCHIEKDKTTALRRDILRQQLRGELNLTFTEHRTIFLGDETHD